MSPIEGFPTTAEDWYERTGREAGTVQFKYDPKYKWGHFLWVVIAVAAVVLASVYLKGMPWTVIPFAGVIAVLVLMISAIVFGVLNRRALEIDYDKSVIRLKYFIYPIRFVDVKPKREEVIPFDQIENIFTFCGRWQSTTHVYTEESRFVIHECFTDRYELVSRLKTIAAKSENRNTKPFVVEVIKYAAIVVIVSAVLLAASWTVFP